MKKYHLDSVNIWNNQRTRLTRYPMTHEEVCTMKAKFTDHAHRRLELVEVVTMANEEELMEMIKAGA